MLEELARKDSQWREIATKITGGNKSLADDIVNEMYLRRYDNDRGQPITDYYVVLTMKSIFLNSKKTEKLILKDNMIVEDEGEAFEPNDDDKQVLDAFNNLSYIERELIELSFDYSLREIQDMYNINYGYVHRIVTGARKKVLGDRINEYQNQRLKHMKSKGLGDSIAKITQALGIKKLVSKITKDCGCDERQALLNERFKYKLNPRCLTPEEIAEYGAFVKNRGFKIREGGKAIGKIQPKDIMFLFAFYDSVFSVKSTMPTCTSCAGTARRIVKMVSELDTVYIVNKK